MDDRSNLNLYWWSAKKAATLMDISVAGFYHMVRRGYFPDDALMEVPDIGVFVTPAAVLKVTSEMRMAKMRLENRQAVLDTVVGIGYPLKELFKPE